MSILFGSLHRCIVLWMAIPNVNDPSEIVVRLV